MNRKASKIKVNILDLSGKEKEMFDFAQSKDPRKDLDSTKATDTWGYVETPNGIYLLCDEGVGSRERVSEENPARFEFRRYFKKDESTVSVELGSYACLSMNDEDLLQLPVKKITTLDKFIRIHNDRLESNYRQWQDYLSREMSKPKSCSARERIEQKKEEEAFKNSEIAELLT